MPPPLVDPFEPPALVELPLVVVELPPVVELLELLDEPLVG
jgi:hypothetical protein